VRFICEHESALVDQVTDRTDGRENGTKKQREKRSMNEELEQIAKDVVDASIKLHIALGPGLLESVYIIILQKKLQERGYNVTREVPIPVEFEGLHFELGFRADLIINDCFIVELKSVEKLAPVHGKQLLTYLKLIDYRLGLLINFGEALLKNGVKRIAN